MNELIAALKAIADPTRVRLIGLLGRAELAVTDLTRIVGQSQPRVSRHLKILTDAALIERHKEGSWVFYRLPVGGPYSDLVRSVNGFASAAAETTARDFDRLKEILSKRSAQAQHYFDAHAEVWDQIRSLHVAEAKVEQAVLDLIGDKPIRNLLDVGTGTGRMLEVLAPRTENGIGIDSSREMLALARARLDSRHILHCQVRHADFYALPGDDAHFDTIMFHQVLHFADDPMAAIREAARVLSPEGRLIVVDFQPHTHDALRDEFEHRRLGFADEQIAGYFSAAGLRTTSISHLAGGDLGVGLWMAEH